MRFTAEQYAAIATFLLTLPAFSAPLPRAAINARNPGWLDLIEDGVHAVENGMDYVKKGEEVANRVTNVANKVSDGVNTANQAVSAVKSAGQGAEHLLHIPDAQERAAKKAAKKAGHRRDANWLSFAENNMKYVHEVKNTANRVTNVANTVGDGVNAANNAASAVHSVGQDAEHLLHIPDAQQRADKKAAEQQQQQGQRARRRSERWSSPAKNLRPQRPLSPESPMFHSSKHFPDPDFNEEHLLHTPDAAQQVKHQDHKRTPSL